MGEIKLFMMSALKNILFGCDNTSHLASVVHALSKTGFSSHNIITSASLKDLHELLDTLETDLIIFCFKNNQSAINTFASLADQSQIPVLCLGNRSECDQLEWNVNRIIFTFPIELIDNSNLFCPRISSIHLLATSGKRNQGKSAIPHAPGSSLMQNDHTRNLSRYVMELDQKTEVLRQVKDRISHLFPNVDDPTRNELNSIVNAIKASASDQKLWNDFKMYFEETNPGFLMRLAEKHPELTSRDMKYCCYLKMNMSNDDIRSLLGINQESVRTHKYRLKKKMEIPAEQDILSYLRALETKA
jgi:DNA-binding CsgD family transcriptional regulator